MPICNVCNTSILKDSKFCPQCGDPVTEEDYKSVPILNNQVALARLVFGYSASSNYLKAVNICKNIPSYETHGDNKHSKHIVTLPVTELELITNLYDLVGTWKSSQLFLNGNLATKKQLTYYGLGCYKNRQQAYNHEEYCFGEHNYEKNIWGCKKLNMPSYDWGGGWLEYGYLDKSGTWHLDKQKIRHHLNMAIRENDLCPVLNPQRIMKVLDDLPDTINPKKDKNWSYVTSYQEVNGDLKEVCVGIRPTQQNPNSHVVAEVKIGSEIFTGKTFSDVQASSSKTSWLKRFLVIGIIFLILMLLLLGQK
ncbi:MAG: zinc ribbon domain-containing protein [Alphaproteobacteria bacterium]|nr:zinc ribbon domain-containing protein [Alphaproteobacteria bacterium]QQS57004.1 MAG: zinc ribbon domain-containing protein [Alphaproteobacteria bacterium]